MCIPLTTRDRRSAMLINMLAAQFRKRPEECQQRSSAWCDLHGGPVRRARCDGVVSECARFRERVTSRRLPR